MLRISIIYDIMYQAWLEIGISVTETFILHNSYFERSQYDICIGILVYYI